MSDTNSGERYWIVKCKHCGCSVQYSNFGDMCWNESAADTRHAGTGCRRVAEVIEMNQEVLF